MEYEFLFLLTQEHLIGESRQCYFTGQPESMGQAENADTPQSKEMRQPPELHADGRLNGEVVNNVKQDVGIANTDAQNLHGRVAQTNERVAQMRGGAEMRQAYGFITDAAADLIKKGGFLDPVTGYREGKGDNGIDNGIRIIENRLNISGKPEIYNYTAIAGRLYVEAIDTDGLAQKFEVPLDASFEKNPDPIATYKTAKISEFYKKSRELPFGERIHDDFRIKTGGQLSERLKEADMNNIVLKRAERDSESDIVAVKDGKIIGRTTASINDREEWERDLQELLANALQKRNSGERY